MHYEQQKQNNVLLYTESLMFRYYIVQIQQDVLDLLVRVESWQDTREYLHTKILRRDGVFGGGARPVLYILAILSCVPYPEHAAFWITTDLTESLSFEESASLTWVVDIMVPIGDILHHIYCCYLGHVR